MICKEAEAEQLFRDSSRTRRDLIVERYRYLCRRGARKFSRRTHDRADLEQVAAVGLIKAVDRYRDDSQTPFEAYAWIVIQGELLHYVRDHERVMRAPRRLQELERRWRVAREELVARLNREARDEEIADHLLVHRSAVAELREYRERANVASLDGLSPSEACYTIESLDDRLVVEHALQRLSPIERKILRATFEYDVSVAEIAQRLGYSQRHVSRLRKAAIEKILPLCVR